MNIELALNKVNERMEEVLSSGGMPLRPLYVRAGLNVGKRLRARIFFSFAGHMSDAAIDLACCVELLHAATLIHDDVLDNARSRRGMSALYLERGVPESVLYGDFIFSEAFKLVSAAKDPVMTAETVSALSTVLKGEIMEHDNRGNLSISRQDYFSVIGMKTGCLFGLSAKLGSLTGPDTMDPCKAFDAGLNAGTSYQIIDDLADYTGADKGKQRFNDIREGVVTLPLIILLEKCTQEEKRSIVSLMGRDILEKDDTGPLLDLFLRYNIVPDVLDEAEQRLDASPAQVSEMTKYIKEYAENARKEYRDRRRGIRGDQRPEAAKKA